MTRKDSKSKKNSKSTALNRYALYERAVQDAPHDVEILSGIYEDLRKKPAYTLREDFCGTYWLCCEWVRSNKKRKAIGLDIDPVPIAYGDENHFPTLNEEQQSRVDIRQENVLSKTEPVDLINAGNFSYCIFKKRKDLIEYFRYCYESLNDDGIMTMDTFGGTDCESLEVDKTKIHDGQKPRFTYIWEQESFNPITRESMYRIHFDIKDGKKMRNAFSYDWRMWTIPELRECLEEAGFEDTKVYWEDEDDDEEANGEFYRTEVEENDPTWIAYIVGLKKKGKKR